VNSGGIFSLNNHNQTLGSLSGNGGTVALGSGGALIVGNGVDTSFAGSITGGGSLTKQGNGRLILTGSSAYSGGTNINAGALQLGVRGGAGAISGSVANVADFDIVNGRTAHLVINNSTASGKTSFYNASTAGNATITNSIGGSTHFNDGSTAGTAFIRNEADTTTIFNNRSSAGRATIDNQGGTTIFRDSASAGSAIITVTSGGTILFQDSAKGGTATLNAFAGGTVDFSGLTRNTTVGSIDGAGNYVLGNRAIAVGGNNQSTTVSGVVSGDSGALVKQGNGTLVLGGFNTYTGGTAVNRGTVRLGVDNALAAVGALIVNSGGTLDLDDHTQTLGALSGNGGTVALGSGALTVGDDTSTTFLGVLSGNDGRLIKQGSGTLTLGGTNTYTGLTTVSAGRLAINGSIVGSVTVGPDGSLGGSGTIGGSVTINGTVSPGNSIGTLFVTGTYTQAPGSVYQVEINPAGQSDRIAVTGNAVLNGGTVAVLAARGTYQRNTTYTILSATGGVNGTYDAVTTNLAFLKPSLSYASKAVTVTLGGGTDAFRSGAQTPNQAAVAGVLDQASSTAAGDFNDVLNALFNLDSNQGPKVLETIRGQNYSGFSSLAIQGAQSFMDSFQFQAGGGASGGMAGPARQQQLPEAGRGLRRGVRRRSAGVGRLGRRRRSLRHRGGRHQRSRHHLQPGRLRRRPRPPLRQHRAGRRRHRLQRRQRQYPGHARHRHLQHAPVRAVRRICRGAVLSRCAGRLRPLDNRMSRPIVIPACRSGWRRATPRPTPSSASSRRLQAGDRAVVRRLRHPFVRLQGVTSTQAGFSETGADSLNLTVASRTTNSLRSVWAPSSAPASTPAGARSSTSSSGWAGATNTPTSRAR
jgi:autotransporter-associated beta strand protein